MSRRMMQAAALVFAAVLVSVSAQAAAIDVLVGDKDGFGFGLGACPNTGACAGLSTPPIDNRSLAEAAAVNGAQFTDIYSALFPTFGPNAVSSGDVLLPFSGTLLSGAILSVAMGDVQADVFGAMSATINGISVPFSFADGRNVDAIHSFVLTAAQTAAANLAGKVDLFIDHGTSGDFVSFDWFELTGEATAVPEPSYSLLLGIALVGIVLTRRALKASARA